MKQPKIRFIDLETDIAYLRIGYQSVVTEEQKRAFFRKYRAVVMHYKIEWSSLGHNLRKEFNLLV